MIVSIEDPGNQASDDHTITFRKLRTSSREDIEVLVQRPCEAGLTLALGFRHHWVTAFTENFTDLNPLLFPHALSVQVVQCTVLLI